MKIAVVVSTWTGHPPAYLEHLGASLRRHPAGAEHHLVLVANGLSYAVPASVASLFADHFVRENVGFNLGAWDEAWRRLAGYDHFLFLQDDCWVKQAGWLHDFVERFQSVERCGIVAEQVNPKWDRPWDELAGESPHGRRIKPSRQEKARHFRSRLREWGIDEGATGEHATTVVQFTSRAVLEAVDGYPVVESKLDAIAAEVAFSRKVAAAGYRIVQLGSVRHSRIGHRQGSPKHWWERVAKALGARPRA